MEKASSKPKETYYKQDTYIDLEAQKPPWSVRSLPTEMSIRGKKLFEGYSQFTHDLSHMQALAFIENGLNGPYKTQVLSLMEQIGIDANTASDFNFLGEILPDIIDEFFKYATIFDLSEKPDSDEIKTIFGNDLYLSKQVTDSLGPGRFIKVNGYILDADNGFRTRYLHSSFVENFGFHLKQFYDNNGNNSLYKKLEDRFLEYINHLEKNNPEELKSIKNRLILSGNQILKPILKFHTYFGKNKELPVADDFRILINDNLESDFFIYFKELFDEIVGQSAFDLMKKYSIAPYLFRYLVIGSLQENQDYRLIDGNYYFKTDPKKTSFLENEIYKRYYGSQVFSETVVKEIDTLNYPIDSERVIHNSPDQMEQYFDDYYNKNQNFKNTLERLNQLKREVKGLEEESMRLRASIGASPEYTSLWNNYTAKNYEYKKMLNSKELKDLIEGKGRFFGWSDL